MGRIVINNIAHQRTLGANNLEQVVGKTDFDFFPRELAAQYDADEKEVVRSGESLIDKVEPFIDKDHNQRWLLTTKVPLRDRQGTITGIVGFNHDITERKQADEKLAEERNLLRTLIDNLPDRIMAMDSQGRKTLTNLADLRASGGNKMEDMIGKTDLDIYPPDLAAEFWAIDKAVLDTGMPNINHEEGGLDAEGNPVWVLSTKVPLRDGQGNVVGLVGIGRDITERKQTEAQIQSQVETLGMLYNLSRGLAEMEDFNAILDLLTRQAVEATHVTFSRILLVENGDLVARAAFPIRALDHDLQVGQREPLASHPFCKRILEEYTPRVLQSDSPEAGDCAPFFLGIAQTLCFVPLHTRECPLGLMILGEVRTAVREPFTEEKVHLARSIGDQAASSLHRALLYEATVRQLDQLRSLHDIDRAISGSVDLRMTLNVILEQTAAQLQVDAAGVLLLNPHTQILEYAAGRGFRSQAYERTRVRLGEGQAGRAALERRIIQHPDFAASGAVFAQGRLLAAENVAAYFVVPLVAKGEVKGVLEIFHRSPLKPDLGWIDFLETLAGQAAIAIDGAQLFDHLQRANIDLTIAYDRTIEGWSHALDLRDKETEGHTLRVAELAERLARSAGVAQADLIHIRRGALLHDIGKMGVPDDVLLKPDKLTDDEWVLMRRHPQFAFDMLAPIAHLKPALDIPYCHHEKWDGTGYPRGLKGEQIPLAARLFAVVDVWDALLSDRPYRRAWPEEKVLEYIKAGSGTHFDPKAVQLFLKMIREEAREHGQGAG